MASAPTLPTSELIQRCAEQETRFRNRQAHDPGYCYELFRRAIAAHDPLAWQALYTLYRGLICKGGVGSNLDPDSLVHETLVRFWQWMRDLDFVERLPTMAAVAGALRKCARSHAISAARRQARQHRLEEALAAEEIGAATRHDNLVLDDLARDEMREYLLSRLRDDDERLVFRLSWDRGLKPEDVVAQFPHRFPDVHQVYAIKERFIRRLAQDPMVQRKKPW
jgi:DNA-directed RNA polymerase specialized sigma24 family protein